MTGSSSNGASKRSLQTEKSRRANHEGTLSVLPSGKFRYRAKINDRWVSGRACHSKSQALKSFRDALSLDSPTAAKTTDRSLFGPYVEETVQTIYRRLVETGTMAPTTWALYESVCRVHLSPHRVSKRPLRLLTQSDIEEWLASLKIGAASKIRYLSFIAAVLARAVTNGAIANNPAVLVKRPEQHVAPFRTLSFSEQAQLLALMPNDRLKIATWLMLHGLSRSEVCGLKRSDVAEGCATLARQVQRLQGKLVQRDRLKTHRRKAVLPLDPDLVKAIAHAPTHPRCEFVLFTEAGRPYSPDNLYRDFKRAVANTPFADLKPYDLRHTFAMSLLESHTDLQTCAELMRHSLRTFARYPKSRDSLKFDAVQRLSAARSHNGRKGSKAC